MHNIEVGDLLIGPSRLHQAYRVLSVDEVSWSWQGKSDPYLELSEFPESDEPSDFGMTFTEAKEWGYVLYKPAKQ